MKSYKAEMQTFGDPKYYSNQIRLPTEAEAVAYASDLAWRWTAVENHRVVESDEQPNHNYTDGKLVRM